MRVPLYRAAVGRRARNLLAVAMLLPLAGILASGLNPRSIGATIALVITAASFVVSALRPVAHVTRTGILIAGTVGRTATRLAWSEITVVDYSDGLVSLTTTSRSRYQIQVDPRSARFLSRIVGRVVLSGRF